MERNMQQFIAVAEAGSISSAANLLNVTQPTITVNIRNLEERFGAPLFERTARGMVLTECGTILYDHARIMSRLESQAHKEIERKLANQTEILSLGTGDAWWRLFVGQAIERQHREMPNATIRIETGSNLQCMWMLLAGEVTASIGHSIPLLDQGLGIEFVGLFKARDCFFVQKNHPLAGSSISVSSLADYHCISTVHFSRKLHGFLTSTDEQQQIGKANLHQPTITCNSIHACIDLVKMTNGYTVFPEDMAPMLALYDLRPLSLGHPLEAKTVGIYFRSETREDRQAYRLIELIIEAAREYRT